MATNMINSGLQVEGASMDQVRELLFGTQLKELEVHLQRQSEQFQREIADARDALKVRIESVENFMKSEAASILNRINAEKAERESSLRDSRREFDEAIKNEHRERAEWFKNEQRERSDSFAQLAKDLASAIDVFERKLAVLAGTLDNTERELRKLLQAESGILSEKIEGRYEQAQDALKKTADQIRHDMVYRPALSGMLTEMAVKLSGKWPSDIIDTHPSKAAGNDLPAKPARGAKAEGKQNA
jgi:chromosome segregation ATPase